MSKPVRNPIEGSQTPEFIRYVVYHPQYGILLGKGGDGSEAIWSKVDHKDRISAVTFRDENDLAEFLKNVNMVSMPPINSWRMVEVIADTDDYAASKKACVDRTLPSW
jgi:hypothetical protein